MFTVIFCTAFVNLCWVAMPFLQFVVHHYRNLNGSHPIAFITKQTTLIQSSNTGLFQFSWLP